MPEERAGVHITDPCNTCGEPHSMMRSKVEANCSEVDKRLKTTTFFSLLAALLLLMTGSGTVFVSLVTGQVDDVKKDLQDNIGHMRSQNDAMMNKMDTLTDAVHTLSVDVRGFSRDLDAEIQRSKAEDKRCEDAINRMRK